MTTSRHVELLAELGFDVWTEKEFADMPEWEERRVIGPCFWTFAFRKQKFTFAFDECGEFWAAEGIVDLGAHGFRQMNDEDEIPSPPSIH